jgi:tetratricopeptide (TPR) repeat protein
MRVSIQPARRGRVAALVATMALAMFPLAASAHDGLAEQIAGVTAQIATNPANPDLFVRRATLFRAARQWKQAGADLDRAASLSPGLPDVDLVRAHLHFDTGNPKAAMNAASRFLGRQPQNVDALLVRARARATLGLAHAAAADYTLALDKRPAPDVYIERARVTAGTSRSTWEDALRGLDEGITRLGPIVTLENEAIDLELRLRRYDAALTRLDRLMQQTRRKEGWLARRGSILERARRFEEALAAYREGLAAAAVLPPWTQRTPASVALVERLRADIDRLHKRRPAAQTPREERQRP